VFVILREAKGRPKDLIKVIFRRGGRAVDRGSLATEISIESDEGVPPHVAKDAWREKL